jgi:hypothetical protein
MSAALEDARRQSRFKAGQERIRKIVDAAPPLTPAQRERLALLLHPGTPGGGADAA